MRCIPFMILLILLCSTLTALTVIGNEEGNQSIATNETISAMFNATEYYNYTLDNITETNELNETNETTEVIIEELFSDFSIIGISPTEAKNGDVLFSIEIKNTGTLPLEELTPIVTGFGFSTYNIIPLQKLSVNEKGYAYVYGVIDTTDFDAAKNFSLSVKIKEKKEIFVINLIGIENITVDDTTVDDINMQQELQNLSDQLTLFEAEYAELEEQIKEKEEDYYVNDITLADLKEYLTKTRYHILAEDYSQANITLILSRKEIEDIHYRLEHVKKKTLLDIMKDNILLISTFAGAVITLVTFYEFVKRKQAGIYNKIKEFKVNSDTKIEVHQKGKKK